MTKKANPLDSHRDAIARCVRCGACRSVCPSFLLERRESFSARGRMALIRAVYEAELPATAEFYDRIGTCTGCLACEDACASGVPVSEIVQTAREQIAAIGRAPFLNGLVSRLLRYPRVLAAGAGLAPLALHYQRGSVSGERRRTTRSKTGDAEPASERKEDFRGTLLFFPGCAITLFQPDIGSAAARVLSRAGYRVILPENPGCCGKPLLALGDRAGAQHLAEQTRKILVQHPVDAVVTACPTCSLTFKKEYPKLLGPNAVMPRVLDVHELLGRLLSDLQLGKTASTITWHDPCHLGRGQGLTKTARNLLRSIPGITLREMENPDRCCGFGGVMRLRHYRMSDGIGDYKAGSIIATKAQAVVTGCPGCRMQIAESLKRAGSKIEVLHTLQVLDRALQ